MPDVKRALVAALLLTLAGAAPAPVMPHYDHIFVIVEENKKADEIVGSEAAPNLTALAKTYGYASNFFAETHPSEPNYVAMVGGYTYGIQDDDAYYCHPNDDRRSCSHSREAGYADHTVDAPSLASQLEAKGLTWKNYDEDLPAPGSLAVYAHLYASKHDGFINFKSVQNDPELAQKMVGFDRFYADLASGAVPNFSFVVPNLCNEMHGTGNPLDGDGCLVAYKRGLIWRGDLNVEKLVDAIVASSVWKAPGNAAIVVTFDEDDGDGTQGCCGNDPSDRANVGGGHIATVVITNHGPRGVVDATPYNHYSLLRTIQDAFGLRPYLARAGAPGVASMVPLFAVPAKPSRP